MNIVGLSPSRVVNIVVWWGLCLAGTEKLRTPRPTAPGPPLVVDSVMGLPLHPIPTANLRPANLGDRTGKGVKK